MPPKGHPRRAAGRGRRRGRASSGRRRKTPASSDRWRRTPRATRRWRRDEMAPGTYARAMALMQVHYRQEIAQETKDVWWASLSDLPDDLYLAACKRAMREEEHFPLPGTLVRFVGEARTVVDTGTTPYHLRALPSPDERAAMRHH